MSTPNSQITVLSWEVCTIHNPHSVDQFKIHYIPCKQGMQFSVET